MNASIFLNTHKSRITLSSMKLKHDAARSENVYY